MSKKILILGLGMGSFYKNILEKEHTVITFDTDINKSPTYSDLSSCLDTEKEFDLSIVVLPNFLHKEYTEKIINNSKIVLVEKPGFKTLEEWQEVYQKKQNIFMIKNNMFRNELDNIVNLIKNCRHNEINKVCINWISKDRIPKPGSWFTNKDLAFGGVTRDLLPHLLSIYYYLTRDETVIRNTKLIEQYYTLKDVKNTTYGSIDLNGVYNVDDYCHILLKPSSVSFPYILTCSWKNKKVKKDLKIDLEIHLKDKTKVVFDFDLCPEYCYEEMFKYFLSLESIDKETNFKIDQWIHRTMQDL